MKINEEILRKAQDIIEKDREIKIYVETCVRAGLCPRCGEPLNRDPDHDELNCPLCNEVFTYDTYD